VVFVAFSACGGGARAPELPPPSAPLAAAPSALEAKPLNTTGLSVESLAIPSSRARVRVIAPLFGARLALASARDFEVRWLSENLDADGLGIDVELDANRPRRLPASAASILLGSLVPAGEEPSLGEHWLFVAPISASALVPRDAAGARAAVAVRFSIGEGAPSATERGAVWLHEPEGTYNGPNDAHIPFEAIAFSAEGAPLPLRCEIRLSGKRHGELDFPGPFSIAELESGDYDVTAFVAGNASSRTITVNAELGRPK
jgi:hypothetical protein